MLLFYRLQKKIIAAFVTTQLRLQKNTDIELLPTSENGLKTKSVVLLNKIATLEKGLITGKLGRLTEQNIMLINKNLIKIFHQSLNYKTPAEVYFN